MLAANWALLPARPFFSKSADMQQAYLHLAVLIATPHSITNTAKSSSRHYSFRVCLKNAVGFESERFWALSKRLFEGNIGNIA
jgi:hypothetical protein